MFPSLNVPPLKKLIQYLRFGAVLMIALSLGGGVILGTTGSDESIFLSNAAVTEKNEIIYARLSSDGKTAGVYVVNHLIIDQNGLFTDHGAYNEVINLTNLNPLLLDGTEVTLIADDKNFFYQGNLTNDNLPWIYEINYYLDGVKIPPSELAGLSGHLEIRITSRKGAVNEIFYDNYMQQITIALDVYKCQNILAKNATEAGVGETRIFVYTVLPGRDADISITTDVTDFEMTGIEITAMPFAMSMDIQLADDITQDFVLLFNAIAELNDGAEKLKDGAALMRGGAETLHDASSQFNSGLALISGSSSSLTDGSAQIEDALSQISLGLQNINVSENGSLADLTLLPAGLKVLANGLTQVSDGMDELGESFSKAYTALDSAIMNIPDYQFSAEQLYGLYAKTDENEKQIIDVLLEGHAALLTVKATYQQVRPAFLAVSDTLPVLSKSVNAIEDTLKGISEQIDTAFTGDPEAEILQLTDAISTLSANYTAFHNGLVSYIQGIDVLANGYNTLNLGVTELYGGISEASLGINALHTGTSQMADETANMTGIMQTEIEDMISDYIGGDFEVMSFTSDKNANIGFVQFVFIADGIKKPKAESVNHDDAAESSIWERLLDLFQ